MYQKEFSIWYREMTHQLLEIFTKEKEGENIVFSPFSILSMLSVLADASAGKTREQILQALNGWMPLKGIPEKLRNARKEMTKIDFKNITLYENPFGTKPVTPDYGSHLHTENAAFVRADFLTAIRPQFLRYFRETYDGQLFGAYDVDAAMDAWIEQTTEGYLEQPKSTPQTATENTTQNTPQTTTNSQTAMALVNTIFFEAMWLNPYKNKEVKKRVFYNCDNTRTKVNMMYGSENAYIETKQATGFVKYFQQCDYCFVALLPKQKGPEALNALAETADFSFLMRTANYQTVHTVMPEFNVEFDQDLKHPFAALGITEALTPDADFSCLATEKLPASKMLHRAKIEINRHGAKAAAATEIVLDGCLPPEEEEKTVIFIRPFVFAIIHRTLRIPVFVGIVNRIEGA